MAMLPRIYCDMDGVLADFKTAAVKTTGMSINKWMNIPSSKKKWEAISKKVIFGIHFLGCQGANSYGDLLKNISHIY